MLNVGTQYKPRTYTLVFLLLFVGFNTYADYEWVTIESGSFGGYGFDLNKDKAHDECEADMENTYHQLAARCCESDPNSDYPMYEGRCAVNNTTGKNQRSFFGGSGSYFCWPRYTETQMATGYWMVTAGTTDYYCKELMQKTYSYTPTVDEAVSSTPPSFVDPEDTPDMSIDRYVEPYYEYKVPSYEPPVGYDTPSVDSSTVYDSYLPDYRSDYPALEKRDYNSYISGK